MRYVILLMLLLPAPGWAGETIRVAVAANFRHTLEAINAGFEAHSGHRVLVSSASTGVLYSQIVYGAPFDVFFAADTTTPAKLTSARTHTVLLCARTPGTGRRLPGLTATGRSLT